VISDNGVLNHGNTNITPCAGWIRGLLLLDTDKLGGGDRSIDAIFVTQHPCQKKIMKLVRKGDGRITEVGIPEKR
ncbi:MAG: hypothetical protein ACI9ND_002159, partial [Yoonia sp.]